MLNSGTQRERIDRLMAPAIKCRDRVVLHAFDPGTCERRPRRDTAAHRQRTDTERLGGKLLLRLEIGVASVCEDRDATRQRKRTHHPTSKEPEVNQAQFEEICRDTSLRLQLPDTAALARGDVVVVQGVLMELAQSRREDGVDGYLFVEVGVPAEDRRAEVYQSLLGLQLLLVGAVEGMFVYDAVNDRILFAARMPFWKNIDGPQLAAVLTALATQATTWRRSLLAGKLEEAMDPRRAAEHLGLGRLV